MILSKIQRNADGTIGYMSDFWTITAASEQAGYPASNLLTPDLNLKWVSWGQRASHNWIEAVSDTRNDYRQIALAGLLGLSRVNPTVGTGAHSLNTYFMIIDTQYPIATRRRPPVVSVVLTNLTGSASDLNGPIDPPNLAPAGYATTKMTTSNNAANTVLIATFANYNATERPLLAENQSIRVHYVHSTSPATVPTLEVKMRHNGVTVGSALSLASTEQTSEGFILSYVFNPASLPTLTGQVGIQVTGTSTGTSTPLPIGVEWIASVEYGQDDLSWDSRSDPLITGDIVYPQVVETPTKFSADPENGIVPFEILENETVYVYIELSDWTEQSAGSPFTRTPLGGFEGQAFYAGRLAIAEGLDVGLRETGGYLRRKVSDVNALRTYGGTLRGARNALHWDEHDFNARVQSQSIVATELESFFETAGMRNPVVLVPDENEPGQAIYGMLTRWELNDVGALIEPGMTAEDAEPYYELSFSVIDARARRTLR